MRCLVHSPQCGKHSIPAPTVLILSFLLLALLGNGQGKDHCRILQMKKLRLRKGRGLAEATLHLVVGRHPPSAPLCPPPPPDLLGCTLELDDALGAVLGVQFLVVQRGPSAQCGLCDGKLLSDPWGDSEIWLSGGWVGTASVPDRAAPGQAGGWPPLSAAHPRPSGQECSLNSPPLYAIIFSCPDDAHAVIWAPQCPSFIPTEPWPVPLLTDLQQSGPHAARPGDSSNARPQLGTAPSLPAGHSSPSTR